MRCRVAAVVLSVAGLSAAWLPAPVQAAQRPGPSANGPQTSAAPVAPSAAPGTTLRVRGTIDQYDLSTGVLSLITASGTVRFPVSSKARIRRGGVKVDAAALRTFSGYGAAVRYSELAGARTVESVNVFEKTERNVR